MVFFLLGARGVVEYGLSIMSGSVCQLRLIARMREAEKKVTGVIV